MEDEVMFTVELQADILLLYTIILFNSVMYFFKSLNAFYMQLKLAPESGLTQTFHENKRSTYIE